MSAGWAVDVEISLNLVRYCVVRLRTCDTQAFSRGLQVSVPQARVATPGGLHWDHPVFLHNGVHMHTP